MEEQSIGDSTVPSHESMASTWKGGGGHFLYTVTNASISCVKIVQLYKDTIEASCIYSHRMYIVHEYTTMYVYTVTCTRKEH